MLIGKLFQIGYTPRGSVEADASARLVRPDPRPRTLRRDDAAGAARKAEVRKAEVRRQAEPRNAGVRSVVIEA
jgi:hypothetical protein